MHTNILNFKVVTVIISGTNPFKIIFELIKLALKQIYINISHVPRFKLVSMTIAAYL